MMRAGSEDDVNEEKQNGGSSDEEELGSHFVKHFVNRIYFTLILSEKMGGMISENRWKSKSERSFKRNKKRKHRNTTYTPLHSATMCWTVSGASLHSLHLGPVLVLP